MSKSGYVGIDNIGRKVGKMYVGVDNVARKVTKAYIGVDNVARQWFSSDAPCTSITCDPSSYGYAVNKGDNVTITVYVTPYDCSDDFSFSSYTTYFTVTQQSKEIQKSQNRVKYMFNAYCDSYNYGSYQDTNYIRFYCGSQSCSTAIRVVATQVAATGITIYPSSFSIVDGGYGPIFVYVSPYNYTGTITCTADSNSSSKGYFTWSIQNKTVNTTNNNVMFTVRITSKRSGGWWNETGTIAFHAGSYSATTNVTWVNP